MNDLPYWVWIKKRPLAHLQVGAQGDQGRINAMLGCGMVTAEHGLLKAEALPLIGQCCEGCWAEWKRFRE